jgi:prepilin-type N-terminal cleavage/methylation domain-containing protein
MNVGHEVSDCQGMKRWTDELGTADAGCPLWSHVRSQWPGSAHPACYASFRSQRERVQETFSRTHVAFTLVELVVTLAVVGILAALLFPALSRGRSKAKETLCGNNLQQIYSGLHLYLGDNTGRFPAGFLWHGQVVKVWSPKEFLGGKDGRDTNAPPARVRPLFPYLGPSGIFRCPADAGCGGTTKGGFPTTPTLFDTIGISYFYNPGELQDNAPARTDGLGGKTVEWVKRPTRYALVYEPPAESHDQNQPGTFLVYWHRARKPGFAHGWTDADRGPRISPVLFVDGHIAFVDCSGSYGGFPTSIETRQ